ncbi:MAG: CBS domain-containing protein [archaeon]|nr:CBS domain-containing protein [archaeon]
MKVKGIMTRKVVEITKGCLITEAAELMRKKDISCLVITCGTSIEGIVTERDVLRKIIAEQKMFSQISISEIMTAPVVTIEEETEIYDAVDLMARKHIRRLVVTNGGKMTGIVTESDFVRVLRKLKGP